MIKSNRKILFWFFGAAILLAWGYVWGILSQSDEVDIVIPVEFVDIPKGLIRVGDNLRNIEAKLCGPKSEIEQLQNQNLKYSLSLKDAVQGINTYPVNPDRIKFNTLKRIRGKSVNPSSVKVKIEKEGIRDLPVHLTFTGKAAPGYVFSDWTVKPEMISIRGPVNILEKLTKIDTKPIDVTGATESFRKEIAPNLLENLEIVSSFKTVQADIRISEKIVEKRFDTVNISGKETSLSYEIIPSKVSLTVKGPEKTIEKIDPVKDFQIYVNLKGLKKGVYARPAEISLPVDIVLVSIRPEVFTVTIK